jgi:hypothetical protein
MMLRLLCLCLIHLPALAGDLDAHSKKGLADTQKMLRSSSERSKAIKGDKQAEDVDAKVDALAGSDKNKNEIYDLSAGILEKVAAEAKGDPDKMQTLLQEAQANPQKFFDKYFSAEHKARVRGLAREIEKNGSAGAKP